jgi:hypothetical protein
MIKRDLKGLQSLEGYMLEVRTMWTNIFKGDFIQKADERHIVTSEMGPFKPFNGIPVWVKLSGNGVLLISAAMVGLIYNGKIPFCATPYQCTDSKSWAYIQITTGFMLAFVSALFVKAADIGVEAHPGYKKDTRGFHVPGKFNEAVGTLAAMSVIACAASLIGILLALDLRRGLFWELVPFATILSVIIGVSTYVLVQKPRPSVMFRFVIGIFSLYVVVVLLALVVGKF